MSTDKTYTDRSKEEYGYVEADIECCTNCKYVGGTAFCLWCYRQSYFGGSEKERFCVAWNDCCEHYERESE